MSFEDFSILALAAILFSEAEPLRPAWISDGYNFSLFLSRSHLVVTEQVSSQSHQRFGRRCRKLICGCGGHLGYSIGSILAILCLLGALMLIISFNSIGL